VGQDAEEEVSLFLNDRTAPAFVEPNVSGAHIRWDKKTQKGLYPAVKTLLPQGFALGRENAAFIGDPYEEPKRKALCLQAAKFFLYFEVASCNFSKFFV